MKYSQAILTFLAGTAILTGVMLHRYDNTNALAARLFAPGASSSFASSKNTAQKTMTAAERKARRLAGRTAHSQPASSSAYSRAAPVIGSASCSPIDFTMSTQALSANNALEGTIFFKNESNHACTVFGSPVLTLMDAHTAMLTVLQSKLDATQPKAITLSTGEQAQVRFRWSNGCADKTGPFSVKALFTGYSEYLSAPLQTALGETITTMPACKNSEEKSILQTGVFQ